METRFAEQVLREDSPPIGSRLNGDIVKVLHLPEVKGRLAAEGSEVVGSTTEQAQAVVYSQIDQWVDVVKKTGIKLQ